MTPQDFYAAGFSPCPTPPPCWQRELGTFYTRMQAQGAAYVRHLAGQANEQPDELEAFVGEWSRPWTYWYCWGCGASLAQLLRRLG